MRDFARNLFLISCCAVLASCASSPSTEQSYASAPSNVREEIWKNFQYLRLEPYKRGTQEIPTFPPSHMGIWDAFEFPTCRVRPLAFPSGLMSVHDAAVAEETCLEQQKFAKASGKDLRVQLAPSVEVYFGTDRLEVRNGPTSGFGNTRGTLSFGKVRIAIPTNHKMGQLERPALRRQPGDAFEILSLALRDSQTFGREARDWLAGKKGKRAFVFVHGYNVSFADAALRSAQLAVDLDPEALPIFFSWPSQGAMLAYPVDSQNAEWTEANMRRFFEVIASGTGADSIVVIAHSMGSRPATRALAKLLEQRRDLRQKFKELILAAPDIDSDVFVRDLAPAYASLGLPVTLYASSTDKALQQSKTFNGSPRAGDASPSPISAIGVEVVDATDIETDFLGHAYVAETRPLLTDVTLLMKNRLRADDRPGLVRVEGRATSFWRFKR